ncbi:MAG: hypothetical protein WD066_17270 [Planctomycetaceae bacterium]
MRNRIGVGIVLAIGIGASSGAGGIDDAVDVFVPPPAVVSFAVWTPAGPVSLEEYIKKHYPEAELRSLRCASIRLPQEHRVADPRLSGFDYGIPKPVDGEYQVQYVNFENGRAFVRLTPVIGRIQVDRGKIVQPRGSIELYDPATVVMQQLDIEAQVDGKPAEDSVRVEILRTGARLENFRYTVSPEIPLSVKVPPGLYRVECQSREFTGSSPLIDLTAAKGDEPRTTKIRLKIEPVPRLVVVVKPLGERDPREVVGEVRELDLALLGRSIQAAPIADVKGEFVFLLHPRFVREDSHALLMFGTEELSAHRRVALHRAGNVRIEVEPPVGRRRELVVGEGMAPTNPSFALALVRKGEGFPCVLAPFESADPISAVVPAGNFHAYWIDFINNRVVQLRDVQIEEETKRATLSRPTDAEEREYRALYREFMERALAPEAGHPR